MIEFLEIFLFGQSDVQMAVIDPIIGGALISGGIQLLGGLFGGGQAKKMEQAAQAEKDRLQRKLTNLENSRQDIINPYENISDLSSLATDLSNQMSNPFANLSVATQAAEMEIEQADISLANTLDTLAATGASAGGATALAQAALQSKKGVSASIEQQEAQNEKLRAQGEQQLEQQRVAEQRRLQGIQIGEGQRMQGLEAAGQQFMFGAQENREMQQLNRISTQLGGAQAQQMQASADQTGAFTSTIGGLASIAGSTIGAMAEVRSSPWNADGTLKPT
tara:strand:+ start:6128 stop:6961 length:834 start_codon:yes stop_codon:yes gene_type:complete